MSLLMIIALVGWKDNLSRISARNFMGSADRIINMAMRAPRICGCGKKVPSGSLCPCAVARKKNKEAKRPSSSQRGYDSKWVRARAAYLAKPENKYCACGCGRLADMIDHKIAPKGNMKLFWQVSNWQPYATICNKRKAIRYEGGFGNPIREYDK